MTVNELYQELDQLAPFSDQEDWDNSGLQVGRSDWKADRVLLCVDVTKEVIDQAGEWKADVILSHHPLIFHGLDSVSDRDFVGERILRLAEKHIAYIAMHTCFDKYGMRDAIFVKAGMHGNICDMHTCFDKYGMRDAIDQRLGFSRGELFLSDGRRNPTPCRPLDEKAMMGSLSDLDQEVTLEEICRKVKEGFDLPNVRIFGDPKKPVRRIAVIGGSGKSEIQNALDAKADLLITGDIDHHSGIDAVTQGLCVMDAGHYGLEHVFMDYMEEALHLRLPDLSVRKMPVEEPFLVL